jgi:hypothetical protein
LPSIVLQTTSQNAVVISDKPGPIGGIMPVSGVSNDDQRFVAFSTRPEGPNLYSARVGIFNAAEIDSPVQRVSMVFRARGLRVDAINKLFRDMQLRRTQLPVTVACRPI